MMLTFIKCICRVHLSVCTKRTQCSCVYARVCVDSVYVCFMGVSLENVYYLDGKVSHVAANIVTVVSVRVHTSGNSSGTSSDKYNGTH